MEEKEQLKELKSETTEKQNAKAPQNSNTPVLIVFVVLILLLIGLGVFVIISLPSQLEKEIAEAREKYRERVETIDEAVVPDEDDWDSNIAIDWDENWKEQFTNHSPEEFSGPYYEEMTDCIDETVPYKINREFFSYEKKEDNVCIRVSYIRLEGDIPNIDHINEQLKENALWYAQFYEEQGETVLENIKGSDTGFWVEAYQYVTYNDEDQISIVLDELMSYSYYSKPSLLATNINVTTGTILDNTQILKLDEDFPGEFRTRSIRQNGEDPATEEFTDEEIMQLLRDDSALILFYTPIGMEIGYSYSTDYSSGWITISMEDYKHYLAGM